MAVTAAMVKELRAATDAPMMDCKKALTETEGDFDKAVEWLKEKGISRAAKKADRVAAEGALGLQVADTFASATLVEVNSETDFVAKNDAFVVLLDNTVSQIVTSGAASVEELSESGYETGKFSEYFIESVAKIGEKIEVRRFITLQAAEHGCVNGYVHSDGRVGVLVAAVCDNSKTAELMASTLRNVAMHTAAMKPKSLSYTDFDMAYVESETAGRIEAVKIENEERARLKKPLLNVPQYVSRKQLTDAVMEAAKVAIQEELKAEGKPEKIWDKILPGKLERFIDDNTLLDQEQCLLDQKYVLNDKLTVAEAVAEEAKQHGGTCEIVEFVRYEVGEGLEKKSEDFAAEVAKQMA